MEASSIPTVEEWKLLTHEEKAQILSACKRVRLEAASQAYRRAAENGTIKVVTAKPQSSKSFIGDILDGISDVVESIID